MKTITKAKRPRDPRRLVSTLAVLADNQPDSGVLKGTVDRAVANFIAAPAKLRAPEREAGASVS